MPQIFLEKQTNRDKDKYSVFEFNSSNNDCIVVKGKMKKSVSFWHTIGASQKVIDTIEFGYKIPFIDTPKRVHFCNSKSVMENVEFLSNSINDLLKTGSAVETCVAPEVKSPLSVATSSAGKKRLILDLRYVNSHIYKEYIHFEDWHSFEKFLVLDGFVYKFD